MKWITSAGLIVCASLVSPALAAAPQKTPPACAAIAFRPIASGMTDGEQDAGLYKSRFGRIELKATVKSGEAQDYHVEVDGKQPTAAATPPSSLGSCAQSKRLPAPGGGIRRVHGRRLQGGGGSCRQGSPGGALCSQGQRLALLPRGQRLTA